MIFDTITVLNEKQIYQDRYIFLGAQRSRYFYFAELDKFIATEIISWFRTTK